MDALKGALKGQYHAGMDMMKGAIDACPPEMWAAGKPPRQFYRLAYHALFYTELYLQVHVDDFVRWEHHRDEVEGDEHTEILEPEPYTKEQLVEFWQRVDDRIDPLIDKIDLSAKDCGIPWYKIPKLDHVLLNLRHLQEHAGQLRDRLLEAGIDQRWHTIR